jgi:hypothetical protein
LTGVVAGAVIANAVIAQPVTYSASYYCYGTPAYPYNPPPVYYPPPPPAPPRIVVAPAPVACAPSPVIVYRSHACVIPQPVISVTFGRYHDRPGKHLGHNDHGTGYYHR